MKTLSKKLNPAFKENQPLPFWPALGDRLATSAAAGVTRLIHPNATPARAELDYGLLNRVSRGAGLLQQAC